MGKQTPTSPKDQYYFVRLHGESGLEVVYAGNMNFGGGAAGGR
jgi:hypothetical protein